MKLRFTIDNLFDGLIGREEIDAVAPESLKKICAGLADGDITSQNLLKLTANDPELYAWVQENLYYEGGHFYYAKQ